MCLSNYQTIRSAAFALVTLFGMAVLSSAANADLPTDVRNKQLVTQAFDRWAAGGTSFFTEILSPDVVWTIKGSGPSAGVYKGSQAFVERAVRPFVSRLSTPVRPVSKQIWADGDHVIVQWDGAAVARDGKAYANSYAWVFHMRNGKAFEVTAFLDLVPYDDVLRRIPAPAIK